MLLRLHFVLRELVLSELILCKLALLDLGVLELRGCRNGWPTEILEIIGSMCLIALADDVLIIFTDLGRVCVHLGYPDLVELGVVCHCFFLLHLWLGDPC